MPVLEDPRVSATPFVQQSRVLRASRQDVYDAWTRPEILRQWWGPPGSVCILVEIDARVGGVFRFADEALPDTVLPPGIPRSVRGEGTFTEVVPGERLQLTWNASWNPSEHGLVTVTFRDVEGGTELIVMHEKIASASAPLYDNGWSQTLDKLVALLAA